MFDTNEYFAETKFWGGQDRLVMAVLKQSGVDVSYIKKPREDDFGFYKDGKHIYIDIKFSKDVEDFVGLEKLFEHAEKDVLKTKSLKKGLEKEGSSNDVVSVKMPKNIFDGLLSDASKNLHAECREAIGNTHSFNHIKVIPGCSDIPNLPANANMHGFIDNLSEGVYSRPSARDR